MRWGRNQGRGEAGVWLCHERLGYNYRMDELSAALGVAQMRRLEELLAKRGRVARMYTERLSQIPGIRVPYVISWDERIRHDVWYVDHWCHWLELRILLRTIPVVLTRQGLYGPGGLNDDLVSRRSPSPSTRPPAGIDL